MATAQTLYGTVVTAAQTGGVSNWQLPGLIDGRVKVMIDTMVLDTTMAAATTIAIGKQLPVGANVIAVILCATTAQASLTVTIGDKVLAQRYGVAADTALQTAYKTLIATPVAGVYVTTDGSLTAAGLPSATNDCQIIVTTAGATATAGTLTAYILYSLD
jgi:hypothetical protein